MIVITSRVAGFRRAGVAHPATPTEYPDDRFTKAQLAQLAAEPMLVVEHEADAGKPSADPKDSLTAPDGPTLPKPRRSAAKPKAKPRVKAAQR